MMVEVINAHIAVFTVIGVLISLYITVSAISDSSAVRIKLLARSRKRDHIASPARWGIGLPGSQVVEVFFV
jgi:hypothetical protein